jgi:hypothetical protein
LERVGGEAIVIDVEEYANLMIIFRLLELFLADKLFCCNWRKFSLHFATFSLHYFFPNRSNYLWLKKRRGGGRDGVTWLGTEKLMGLASECKPIKGFHVERDTDGDT